jgi:hypothetical protein
MVVDTYVEKRVFERVPCSLKGTYASSDSRTGEVVCEDISALGVRLTTSAPIAVSGRIRINFTTKREVPFCVEGKVCWCTKDISGWQVGVAFYKPLFFPLEIVS